MSRVRLSLSHSEFEGSPSYAPRLLLALPSTIPRTKTCPWEPWSNWATLFIRQVFVFSFFGKFLLLRLLLFLLLVRLPSASALIPPNCQSITNLISIVYENTSHKST